MIRNAALAVLWFAVWALLSWPPSAANLVTGSLVAVLVTFMTHDIFAPRQKSGRSMLRYAWFLCYLPVFLWECLKANLDAAWRVMCPSLPVNPAIVKVRTSLRSDAALMLLANSITLAPGTTAIDIDRDAGIIYVHMVAVRKDYRPSDMSLGIVTKFENILKRIFE